MQQDSYSNTFEESLFTKQQHEIIMIGGLTGVGKTDILMELKKEGCQVINLEELVNHSGSSFGNLNEHKQPDNKGFAELLFELWQGFRHTEPIWVEYETYYIGKVQIPRNFYISIHSGTLIQLHSIREHRIQNIISHYSHFSNKKLVSAASKLEKKVGKSKIQEVISSIKKNDYHKAVDILLYYFDNAYLNNLNLGQYKRVIHFNLVNQNPKENALRLIDVYHQTIKKQVGS